MQENTSQDSAKQFIDDFGAETKVGEEASEDLRSPPGEPVPPRDVHGLKWTLVVLSLISVTFLWVSKAHILLKSPY